MSVLNSIVKILGFIGINLYTLLNCYFTSLVFTSPAICVAMSVFSVFTGELPEAVTGHFLEFYLLLCIPLAVVFFVMVVTKVIDRFNERGDEK